MIKFNVLGPLQIEVDGHCYAPSAAKVRQVLALMLLRANQIVTVDAFIEELWTQQPPRTAVTTVQTYIYQLRKLFASCGGNELAERLIDTMQAGYRLNVTADEVDVLAFDQLVERARQRSSARCDEAAGLYREALALWRGPALVDVTRGELLSRYAVELDEKRLLALQHRLLADLALGRHRELIGELRLLVLSNPFNEWMHSQLMIALHRSGRRGDALDAFHNARRLLTDELGVEPSADLRRTYLEVLQARVPTTVGSESIGA